MPTSTVDGYIADAPDELRPALTEICALIRAALPHATEIISSAHFPVFTDDGGRWIAGLARRKKGPMLYVMASGVLDRYADRLGRLRSGRSCVEWKASKTVTLDGLRELAREILATAAAEMGQN